MLAKRVQARRSEIRITYDDAWDQLFRNPDPAVLDRAKARYAEHFASFVTATTAADTLLLVVYLPSTEPGTDKHISETANRRFYRELTHQHNVPFFDLTDALRQYDWRDMTLLPQDGHLSRFGNRIVARELNQILQRYAQVRTSAKMLREDQVYGDLNPNLDEVAMPDRYQPHRLITNRQGFRNINSLLLGSSRQRILAIGDSFTYGLHIDNHETWPAILESQQSEREIVNAGIPGYTITHELDLFVNRAQLIAPDITILQVLDNDLLGVHLNE
ncbi:hypothetical protein E3A20_27760 [Planctomyces bekefii]|uniref:AlgX/AlgJ SGNH hydrolase-like domain-containing protein n=1 Tax=Planctomyces bekefii TaxID=1653850 RepID=A0A5C6M015_9PLAN|nr:hypothetical protein E3A20_27760 [Planctomyces bekefii]